MITFQSAPCKKAQLRTFWFHRKMLQSQDNHFFYISNHSMKFQIWNIIMSNSVWERTHFWISLLKHSSFGHKTWSTKRYNHGQYFEYFESFGGLGLSSRSFLTYQPASITHKPVMASFQFLTFFWKKISTFCYCL